MRQLRQGQKQRVELGKNNKQSQEKKTRGMMFLSSAMQLLHVRYFNTKTDKSNQSVPKYAVMQQLFPSKCMFRRDISQPCPCVITSARGLP